MQQRCCRVPLLCVNKVFWQSGSMRSVEAGKNKVRFLETPHKYVLVRSSMVRCTALLMRGLRVRISPDQHGFFERKDIIITDPVDTIVFLIKVFRDVIIRSKKYKQTVSGKNSD